MKSSIAVAVGTLAVLLVAGRAEADGGPYPSIRDLVQSGQDVQLTYVIPGGDLDRGHDLEKRRRNSDHYFVVFEDLVFDKEYATASSIECFDFFWECPEAHEDEDDTDSDTDTDTGEPPSLCEQYPDCCDDCDGDGSPECEGDCVTFYHFLVTDDCVEPGDWVYRGGEGAAGSPNYHGIEVEDTGDSCLDCGCHAVGWRGARSPVLLVVLMLALGGAALLVSRR